ncbi:hypothetical protein P3S67_004820 [Capsicum chacoense]
MRVQLLAVTAVLVLSFIELKNVDSFEKNQLKKQDRKIPIRKLFDMSYGTIGCILRNWAEVGNAAARRASLQAKHIMGPMVSSGWDFFETVYVGGTLAEASIRSVGTLLGSYVGGIMGKGKLGGWFSFGKSLGSWIGGRLGLMLYDVGNGLQFVLQLHQDY